ncbi:hypothetical protein A6A29_35325 [Streptomyces sp. TSRI0281]|nr:hypothetical protein A6A29_35325 [Streptomyces sp. TSRI0281]
MGGERQVEAFGCPLACLHRPFDRGCGAAPLRTWTGTDHGPAWTGVDHGPAWTGALGRGLVFPAERQADERMSG